MIYKFPQNKRIVLYDTLINQVNLSELQAILGHEIGHWKMWHSIQMFVVSHVHSFAMFLSYSYVLHSAELFEAFGFAFKGKEPVIVSLFLFNQVDFFQKNIYIYIYIY